MTTILFYVFAVLTVASACAVILARSPMYSAMSLVGTFFSLAHTIAFLQVLVYAGAIMVLFLLVIMLLSLGEATPPGKVTVSRVVGGLSALGLWVALGYSSWNFVPLKADAPASFGTLQSIGAQLYTQWLAPFEAVSLLLLVAMVGAVVVAKSRI